MSEDDFRVDDLPWDDIGRINQDGYISDPSLEDSPVIFDDQFEMRSRELQRQPAATAPVTVVEAKKGPWSGNNQLGSNQRFAPDANNRQTILKLDEWGMPEVWTLCLGLDFDANNWVTSALAASFDITAFIQFGMGGIVQEVEIDWVNGAAISLPMNAVNVSAQYNLSTIDSEASAVSEPPEDLIIRASLCRGTIFQCEPTRSFSVTIDQSEPDLGLVNIPPFAKAVRIIPESADASTAFLFYSEASPAGLRFLTNTVGASGYVIQTFKCCQLVEWLLVSETNCGKPVEIAVPTGARSISLIGFGASTYRATVQFLIGV